MSEPYTPTTEEIIRSFAIPPHRVIEREEGETFADYLSRLSIEGHGYQLHSEAAAHRWLAEHDRQVAERAWDEAIQHQWVHRPIGNRSPHNPYRKDAS